MEHPSASKTVVAAYREYAPCPELREHVRALFWFGPSQGECSSLRPPLRQFEFSRDDIFFSPVFADGHASLAFELGRRYDSDRGWRGASEAWNATVMGAVTSAGAAPTGEPPAMIGVYLRPRSCAELLRIPAAELTNRVVSLGDVWKRFSFEASRGTREGSELESLRDVEAELLRRLDTRSPSSTVDVHGLASLVRQRGGRVAVSNLAHLAGVSRQHLTRLFHEQVGVSPKLYARLARFRACLRRVPGPARPSWAQLSMDLGYADQSHLIAEFREFSSLTPEHLSAGRRFHPFLGDAEAS